MANKAREACLQNCIHSVFVLTLSQLLIWMVQQWYNLKPDVFVWLLKKCLFLIFSLCRCSLPCPPLQEIRNGHLSLWILSWHQGWSSKFSVIWLRTYRKRYGNCQKPVSLYSDLDGKYLFLTKISTKTQIYIWSLKTES